MTHHEFVMQAKAMPPKFLKFIFKYVVVPFFTYHLNPPRYMNILKAWLLAKLNKKPEEPNEPSTKTSP